MKNELKSLSKKLAIIAIGFTLVACGTGGSGSGARGNISRKADANGMYRVKSGDTLVLIARANGVSYQDIMNWNGLTNPNAIEVGWKLRVRPNASGGSTVRTPVVTQPDTNGGVAVTRAHTPASADRDLGANPVIQNDLRWVWPTVGAVLRPFDGSGNKGVVLAGNLNDAVFAASSGEVIYAGNSLRGYGNMVVIKHNESWSSVYANNNTLTVKQGDRVAAGQVIAKMGSTDAQRVQLYFEVRLNAKPIDPQKVLPARAS